MMIASMISDDREMILAVVVGELLEILDELNMSKSSEMKRLRRNVPVELYLL